uniref:GIY-YIG domain-containing protein n=1 Tax=viral metagenome TaxID=1070528 RepID=A0A6C0JC86_9ZZZZ
MQNKKFHVYAINIDGLVYVGATNDMKRRLKDHRTRCFNPNAKHYPCKFYTYIRDKYNREEAYEKINNGHVILCTVDNKEEARIAEQEYINTMGTLNGKMEINNISNTDRCKLYRAKNHEARRNAEIAYDQSKEGKKKRAEYRINNAEKAKERVTCEKCGHESTRKHISDHKRKGLCI